VIPFASTNFRNACANSGSRPTTAAGNVYVIGKPAWGKTTMIENMVMADIYAGHGVGLSIRTATCRTRDRMHPVAPHQRLCLLQSVGHGFSSPFQYP